MARIREATDCEIRPSFVDCGPGEAQRVNLPPGLDEIAEADAHGEAGLAAGMIAPGTPYLERRETHYCDRNESIAYRREVVNDEFVRMRLVRTS